MQQFTVPQFIDVEDKIIGPITTRQFVILLAAGIFIAILYRLLKLQFGLFIAISVIDLGVSCVFAFVRINGRPFHYFVLNIIQTLKRPKVRVWFKETTQSGEGNEVQKTIEKNVAGDKKELVKSRLNELALIVDTQGRYMGEGGKEAKIELPKEEIPKKRADGMEAKFKNL